MGSYRVRGNRSLLSRFMDKLPHRPEPAAFPAIQQALATARQLPVWRYAPVKVGVCLRDGDVAATAVLDDYRQYRLFSIHLEAMGYLQHERNAGESMQGCDVLFSPRSAHSPSAANHLLSAAAA